MSKQQIGELYYKVGIQGLQDALKDLDKLYDKSNRKSSATSPFNLSPVDQIKSQQSPIKSVAEARKNLSELASSIGVDLDKIVRQVAKMPDLYIKQAKGMGVNPLASYNEASQRVLVRPGSTTPQTLKHEMMHAIEKMVPPDIRASIISQFGPIRKNELSGLGSESYRQGRMLPQEIFASFMERQSPDVIRAFIGSDMATKVAALAGDSAARATVASMSNRSLATIVSGFGAGVGVGADYGRGTRTIANTTTLPPSTLSTKVRPNPDDFGATTNSPLTGDDFGAGVLSPAQKARATAAANAANARASQVQANIAAFMGSNHGGFGGGSGSGSGGSGGNGPGGGIGGGGPLVNPWLPPISSMSRGEHNALIYRANLASDLANEITSQVIGNGRGGVNERLDAARLNVLQEEALPGSTGSNITARQNELVDIQAEAVHLAEQRADIERRVDGILGTQVSHLDKIRASEEAALNYARQRAGRDLRSGEESRIRSEVRNSQKRQLLGGDAADTSNRLSDVKGKIENLRDARNDSSPAVNSQIERRLRLLSQEQDLLTRRQRLLEKQAFLENRLESQSLSYTQRRNAAKSLSNVNKELEQNQEQTDNSMRRQAGRMSRRFNYRLQELSYGVQDFAQVLSGGGGLDGALRAANNNISQFYAAAGGANAARNSMVATGAILGIAAALKLLEDAADAPSKKLEELIGRTKEWQAVNAEIRRAGVASVVSVGDVNGQAPAASRLLDLRSDAADAETNRRDMAELFANRSRMTISKEIASAGWNFMSMFAGANSGIGKELRSRAGDIDIDNAFYRRFSQGEGSKSIAASTAGVSGSSKKYLDVILGSAGTSPEDAAKAFEAIADMGGWAGRSTEELKAMKDEVYRVRHIHKMLGYAAESYQLALSETAENLSRRNALLSGQTAKSQGEARGGDIDFVNQQYSASRQLEAMAESARNKGDARIAREYEDRARDARSQAQARIGGIAPVDSTAFTQGAASLQNVFSPFMSQIQAANLGVSTGQSEIWTGLDVVATGDRQALFKESEDAKIQASLAEIDERQSKKIRDKAIAAAKKKALSQRPAGTHIGAMNDSEWQSFYDPRVERQYLRKKELADEARRRRDAAIAASSAESSRLDDAHERAAAGKRLKDESEKQAKAAREGLEYATKDYVSGFAFSGQQANESFADADDRLMRTYNEKVELIKNNAELSRQAADDAIASLTRSKEREERLRKISRESESRMRSAQAEGTTFDEQRASLNEQHARNVERLKQDFGGPGQEDRLKTEIDTEKKRFERQKGNLELQERRSRSDLRNMFAGDAASLIGGREGQHYANAKQLEDRLRQIEDADKAGMFKEDPMEKQRLLDQAETVFNERQKDINRKQVGFSDIGGMWKQIQMSLKPDKSIELQKTMSGYMQNISTLASGAGLKVNIALSP